jgi:hypothetical protein
LRQFGLCKSSQTEQAAADICAVSSALNQTVTFHARQGTRHRWLLNRCMLHESLLRKGSFDRQGENDRNVARRQPKRLKAVIGVFGKEALRSAH